MSINKIIELCDKYDKAYADHMKEGALKSYAVLVEAKKELVGDDAGLVSGIMGSLRRFLPSRLEMAEYALALAYSNTWFALRGGWS